ncbi:MAG: GNAT family N-acetyltransferase [Thermoplasmata archaeon]
MARALDGARFKNCDALDCAAHLTGASSVAIQPNSENPAAKPNEPAPTNLLEKALPAPGGVATIGRLTHQDIPAICALFKKVWDGYRGELPPELLKTLVPTPLEFTSGMETVTYFAARKDNRFVGVVGVEVENGSGHIVTLLVDPEQRRQGIARQLAQAALEWARHANVNAVWVDPLAKFTAAQSLFRALGFTETGLLHRRMWNEDVRFFERVLER